MRTWWTLTRRELAGYFLSLTGYVIIAAAVFLMGFSFVVLLVNLQQEPTPMPVTEVFYNTQFFWLILLLTTPVITMRLFAQEKFSGTFETLMTTPVSDLQVVLAKFTAAMVFYVVMWLPLLACLLIVRHYTNDAGAFDPGTIGSTYLGILLLGGLFMSLGCCASALTRSQGIAAMISLVFGASVFLLAYLARPAPGARNLAGAGTRLLRSLRPNARLRARSGGHAARRPPGQPDAVLPVSDFADRGEPPLEIAWRPIPNPPRAFRPGASGASFSTWFCLSCLVLAVVVMANYLSRECLRRFHVNTRTRLELAPGTVSLLKSITNQVTVTLYYDKSDPLYGTVKDLLSEFSLVNPRIQTQTIDYTRDAGAAQKLKAQYKLASAADKNLVIFDCEGKPRIVPGDMLAKYVMEELRNEKQERVLQRKITGFLGETAFNQALLDVTSPKPFSACYLFGHGEHSLESGDQRLGYLKFASLLAQNNIRLAPLSLLGTNIVPAECNLLVIAGPTTSIPDTELQKIETYLNEGGRLLALFNANSLDERTGLDRAIGLQKILAKWGVRVGDVIISDPDRSDQGSDVVVSAFTDPPHCQSPARSQNRP